MWECVATLLYLIKHCIFSWFFVIIAFVYIIFVKERQFQLGSAHEVQRFHRDVDETKDWIQEKDEALNNDDCGKDLRSVQALQRKHEGKQMFIHKNSSPGNDKYAVAWYLVINMKWELWIIQWISSVALSVS